MAQLQERRGYKSPRFGAEAQAAKAMLETFAPEDILGCFAWLNLQPFWADKEVLLMSVQKQIGKWVKSGRPKTWTPPVVNSRSTRPPIEVYDPSRPWKWRKDDPDPPKWNEDDEEDLDAAAS